MDLIEYIGPLWSDRRPTPDLALHLDARDRLVEIACGTAPARVVLGVPHHAAMGVDRIAERHPTGGRVADENAVLYALAALEALHALGIPCRVVVAAHATDHDPNKDAASPYCRRVLAGEATELLVECHGAGHRAPHDLELSAGRNAHARPLPFGRLLARALGGSTPLATQRAPGDRGGVLLDAAGDDGAACELRFPALRTRSLRAASERGLAALHLEAKPRYRSLGDGSGRLTADGARLGRSLAEAVERYLGVS